MALILNIESSTEVCSAALAVDGKLVCLKEEFSGSKHSELLTILILSLLKEADFQAGELDAIAVSMGPGSYTGLRIGVSVAKGLCYALEKPLIAISTIEVLARYTGYNPQEFGIEKCDELLFCPMIDARRMEVYTGLYDSAGMIVEPITAKVVVSDSFNYILNQKRICFFGNGSGKCRVNLNHPNAVFLGPEKASARFMCNITFEMYNNREFVNVAYFEPFYLKDFIVTVPKNKII